MMPNDLSNNPLLIQVTRNLIKQKQALICRNPLALAKAAGIAPDPWQAALLAQSNRQMILLCSRQAGKSTVSSILALHEAISRP